MDLTNGYDFTIPAHREMAWKEIKRTDPYVIIGSPPCTTFSRLQALNLHMHRDNPEWIAQYEALKAVAVEHIEFCAQLYWYQLERGRHFIHEHPRDASSWLLPSIQQLLCDVRVQRVEAHMCRFGMTSHIDSRDGPHGRVKKPTSFMTSSRRVAEQLARLCKGDHDHVHLMSGRAAGAQVYPRRLCEAMLRGLRARGKMT